MREIRLSGSEGGGTARRVAAATRRLPRQFLPRVDKAAIRTLRSNQCQLDARLGPIWDLQLRSVRAQLRLYPAGVRRVHFDGRPLQLIGQMTKLNKLK
jgi:hypothetical protein